MKSFKEFYEEIVTEDRYSEFSANTSLSHTSSRSPIKPASTVEQDRQHAVHSAAYSALRNTGKEKDALAAAHKVAFAHAKQDRHDDAAAHEIASRRAVTAVKKAKTLLGK